MPECNWFDVVCSGPLVELLTEPQLTRDSYLVHTVLIYVKHNFLVHLHWLYRLFSLMNTDDHEHDFQIVQGVLVATGFAIQGEAGVQNISADLLIFGCTAGRSRHKGELYCTTCVPLNVLVFLQLIAYHLWMVGEYHL